jgi:hypothetical protein
MKRKRPRIERVPGDYDPRYPRALEREQYEELVAPDSTQRMVAAAAAAASLALGPALAAQGGGESERLESVLAVLGTGVTGGSWWFERAAFQRERDTQGSPIVLPSIPIMFGNSVSGLFDAERARKLAAELFVAYGLRPLSDHRVGDVGASLDVYDPVSRVGVELRGPVPEEKPWYAEVGEVAPVRLDDEEHARLARDGVRVQCVELESFYVADGDRATCMLAYLAGIVAFLNEVTTGPDIDLTAILDKQQLRIDRGPGTSAEESVPDLLQPDAARTITYAIDPGRGYERAIRSDRRGPVAWEPPLLVPAPGSPLLLELRAAYGKALTVEQEGEPPLRVEAAGTLCFLPPRFDPRRPYRVTLHLSSGEGSVEPHLVLYGVR